MGETKMRFLKVVSRILKGLNSLDMAINRYYLTTDYSAAFHLNPGQKKTLLMIVANHQQGSKESVWEISASCKNKQSICQICCLNKINTL